MIYVVGMTKTQMALDNKVVVGGDTFPDGTPLMKVEVPRGDEAKICWKYDSMDELFRVYCLGKKIREKKEVTLVMPYIPNARQDRVKEDEDVFTLKYMAEIINQVGFKEVVVLDAHSDVSLALIDRVVNQSPESYIQKAIGKARLGDNGIVFFPDNGSQKRYGSMVYYDIPQAYGVKKRDWSTGEIKGLDVIGDIPKEPFDVLIVDDISSYGGTFYFSAKKLKELGARDIYLYVTHCENSILKGKLIEGTESGLIKKVFTTDSIYRGENPKVEVLKIH